jgi:excisionase family DNA binding protein
MKDRAAGLVGDPGEGLLSIAEACAYLRVGKSTLYRWMDEGKLASAKIGGCRRVPRAALERLVEESMLAAGGSHAS